LVIGFTGSGKTTLIDYLQTHLDGPIQIIKSGSESVESGCICCNGSESLRQALRELLVGYREGEQSYRRIFIEGSDDTDPIPVIRAIRNRFSPSALVLSEVVTVVNAADFPPAGAPKWLVTNQIFFADRVVVNHCDRATAKQLEACIRQIRSVKWLTIEKAVYGAVEPDDILRL
jgi:G3E family GTPase